MIIAVATRLPSPLCSPRSLAHASCVDSVAQRCPPVETPRVLRGYRVKRDEDESDCEGIPSVTSVSFVGKKRLFLLLKIHKTKNLCRA